MQDLIPGQEYPLEKEMATCTTIFAWRIPWTTEHGGLYSSRGRRVGHDWAAKKEYVKTVYCHPDYLTYMQSTS